MHALGAAIPPEHTRDQLPLQADVGSDIVERSAHPMVRAFAVLWNSRRGDKPLPQRSDFGTEDFLPWFGHVLMLDVIDEGEDFRYRLIGTHITNFMNRDYTARLVSECDYAGARDNIFDSFRRPIQTGGPVFRSGTVQWAVDKSWRPYNSVHCPLAAGDDRPAMTVGVIYFG